jgi:hypothetical protein
MNLRSTLVLAVTVVLAACAGGGASPAVTTPGVPAQAATPTPTPAGIVPAAGTIYLGAFVNTGGPGAATPAMLAAFEQQVGRKMVLSMHYSSWTGAFPGADEADDAANGRIPVISWNCGLSNAQVAAGADDATIASHADAVKAYGGIVFIRYMWEMNLPDTANGRTQCYDPSTDAPSGVFSPTEFIAAWQHIRTIFARHGATNVIWLWNPSGGSNVDPTTYYPGASSVDWVGIDQYDRADVPFAQAFPLYATLAPYGKPMLIAETGANPDNQGAFFAGAVAALTTQFPLVKGLMYFDSAGQIDWHLTPAGISAFAAMGQDPYLSAIHP